MNSEGEKSIKLVARLVEKYSSSIETAAFIGSSSPENREIVDNGSDIDVIILLKDSIDDRFFVEIESNEIKVANIWGIASPVVSGAPLIHMHMMQADAFRTWSSLYRRSIAKYNAFYGRPLRDYCSNGPMTIVELMTDILGPVALYNRLRNEDFYDVVSSEGIFKKTPVRFSEPIDFVLYSTLHSCRNILRYFGKYDENASLDTLTLKWLIAGGQDSAILTKIVNEKRSRRKGNDTISYSRLRQYAIDWFASAIDWIQECQVLEIEK